VDIRAKDLIAQGDRLFSKRQPIMSLWQTMADNFYPERADFTTQRGIGEAFADHLTTSYPLLARRDLGNSFSAMLRPTGKDWFEMQVDGADRDGRVWLEDKNRVMRRAMYDRVAQFQRATKEGDNDFAVFGQCVLSVEFNRNGDALLYRCWHLRDVAWCENYEGRIDTVHRKWKPTARDLKAAFGSRVARQVDECLQPEKDAYTEFECRHIIVPSADYEPPADMQHGMRMGKTGRKWRAPYVSIHLDVANEHVMEEVGVYAVGYVVPRWQTVSGSQYAYSPATIAALPDARLIQAQTLVLLESGEKAVDPPMIGVGEAIRSDVQLFAGGYTSVDADYDERLGEVLRPITQNNTGIGYGLKLRDDVRGQIAEAFFLNKIAMPPSEREMTAFEVGQRIQEYVRHILPLFEPMEAEYNGGVCEETFDLLLRHGAFGSPQDIPQSLRGGDVQFKFVSPFREATERVKGQKFKETAEMLAVAAQFDPGLASVVDPETALRDALRGIGMPATWERPVEDYDGIRQAQEQEAQAQKMLAGAERGAAIAEQAGSANKLLAEAAAAGGRAV
jgi:hypothetical protein